MKKIKNQAEDWNKFPISKEDVLRSFDMRTYTKGNEYFHQNRVKSMKLTDHEVVGKVTGSLKAPYDVRLNKNGEFLQGICSCPVGFDCKHCVALALQWTTIPKTPQNQSGNHFIDEHGKKIHISLSSDDYEKDDESEEENTEFDDSDDRDEDEIDDEDLDNDADDDDEEDYDMDEEDSDEEYLGEEDNDSETDKNEPPSANPLIIPPQLAFPTLSDSEKTIQSLSNQDLRNLLHFFMPAITYDPKISIFSKEFITQSWKSVFGQLDDDYPKSIIKNSEEENQHGEHGGQNLNPFSPMIILTQINDEKTQKICLQNWFAGYVDLINTIKSEFRERGMFDTSREELYEYYKNLEYDRLEADFQESRRDRYNHGDRYWHDYDDELESYEDFELDSSTLNTYLNAFFHWISEPNKEICDYILALNRYKMEEHATYLMKEGISWLLDFKLPKNFMISVKNIESLQDLKTIILSKTTALSITFPTPIEKLDFLFSLFHTNPSEEIANLVQNQGEYIEDPQKNMPYLIEKLWNDYEMDPSVVKYSLLNQLLHKYLPAKIPPFIELLIQKFADSPDTHEMEIAIQTLLARQPSSFVLTLQNTLLNQSLKIPKRSFEDKHELYIRIVNWLQNFFEHNKEYDPAFSVLAEMARKHPNFLSFDNYRLLKKLSSLVSIPLQTTYPSIIHDLLKHGSKDVQFRIYSDLEQFDHACKILPHLSKNSYYSNKSENTQWKSIMTLIPHLSSISDENKDVMLQLLKKILSRWVDNKSSHRPDACIAEGVEQIRTISLSLMSKNGNNVWDTWFKSFANDHYRLRNLQAALARKGIELKKS